MKVDLRSDVRTVAMHRKHPSSCKRLSTFLLKLRTVEYRMVQAANVPNCKVV